MTFPIAASQRLDSVIHLSLRASPVLWVGIYSANARFARLRKRVFVHWYVSRDLRSELFEYNAISSRCLRLRGEDAQTQYAGKMLLASMLYSCLSVYYRCTPPPVHNCAACGSVRSRGQWPHQGARNFRKTCFPAVAAAQFSDVSSTPAASSASAPSARIKPGSPCLDP